MTQPPETEVWLSLQKAADFLNVHPTTVRRWADEGQIPVLLTPGGHRRFAQSALQQFINSRRLPSSGAIEQMWADKAVLQARSHLIDSPQQSWLAKFDEEARANNRRLGRQLMGLTLQYLAGEEDNLEILQEAKAIGLQYGEMSKTMNLPLTEALQAAIFFRDTLVEVALQLPETVRIKPQQNLHLMRRINKLINVVHLAIAQVYDS